MSLSLCFTPSIRHSPQTPPRIPLYKPLKISALPELTHSRFSSGKRYCFNGNVEDLAPVVRPERPRWENWLATAASLYPLYVTVGGAVAFVRPTTFSWFVNMGPTSYSLTLGFIMLSMGITLELKELISLFRQRPLSVSWNLEILCLFAKVNSCYTVCSTNFMHLGLFVSKAQTLGSIGFWGQM